MLKLDFSSDELNKKFANSMKEIPGGAIGVAVSGGGDSVALLALSSYWARTNGRIIEIATVDHGLRKNSSVECDEVKKIATDHNLRHSTIRWLEKPKGNLQNAARNARHRLLSDWATVNNLSSVLLGHTLDDNAETIMLRLIRGSGVDGLSGISQTKQIGNLVLFRPLLNFPREHLRKYLRVMKLNWIEDPSNFDERFDRVKVRNLLSQLKATGLTKSKLIVTANHMSRAKDELNRQVRIFSKRCIEQKRWGNIEIIHDIFLEASSEIQLRLLSGALRWMSGKVYRPRFSDLERLLSAINEQKLNGGRSLMGTLIKEVGGRVILSREFSAIQRPIIVEKPNFIWDGRWRIEVEREVLERTEVGALGTKGLTAVKNFRNFDVPRRELIGSVALFENGVLICLPIISFGKGLNSSLIGGSQSFFNFLGTY